MARQRDRVDGVLLAGGAGRRVGGRDKGLLMVGDARAVDRGLALLRPRCDRLFLSANRNLEVYARYRDIELLPDLRGDFPGPLGAFEALAARDPAPLLLVLPVDAPLVDPQVLQALRTRLLQRGPDVDAVFASDGQRDQFLCACLRSRTLASAAAQLARGDHRVGAWMEQLAAERLVFTGALGASLRNLNDAAAWEAVRNDSAEP